MSGYEDMSDSDEETYEDLPQEGDFKEILCVSQKTGSNEECAEELYSTPSGNRRRKAVAIAKYNLLKELELNESWPLDVALQEYLGMIPKDMQPKCKDPEKMISKFVEMITGANGLPVVIVSMSCRTRHVMLWSRCVVQATCAFINSDARKRNEQLIKDSSPA